MKIRKIRGIAVLFVGVSLSAYAATDTSWSNLGATGPDSWGNLSPDYELCGAGLKQSPVDLSETLPEALPWLEYEYRDVKLSIENNTHTIEVRYHTEGSLTIDGSVYELLQFHFHSPSEHTENGLAAQMEIHFVHINSNNQIAVVGLMVDEGKANALFENIISNAPTTEGLLSFPDEKINATDLLPENPSSYRAYSGSLTTPSCSEAVRWFVLNERVEFSREQIDQFLAIISENA